jgi:glutamate 5-kinase
MGRVTVDAGAARALENAGTSLLPVGVIGCDGAFVAGDAVDVVAADGRRVGKGITALSTEEVRVVAGLRSDLVRRRLPDAPEEVIHRDQFVLLPSG